MTNEQKLEAVRQKIIEAVPEIMQLKLGCKLRNKYQSDDNPYQIKIFLWKTGKKYECLEFDGKKFRSDESTFEIIGRTIRLSDVLIAINRCEKNWHDESWGIALEIGKNWNFIDLISNEHGSAEWMLKNDDLNLQSPETWDLLYNLLCK